MLALLRKRLPKAVRRRILAGLYRVWWPRDWLICGIAGLPWDPTWIFRGWPRVQRRDPGSIRIGRHFTANSHWRFNSVGIFQPVTLKTVRPGATLTIGDRVGVSGSTISAARSVTIGNDVLIGSGCVITDSDAHPLRYSDRRDHTLTGTAPVTIGDGAFIGARCIILKGVTIGRESVIGAGSVVTKDVPPQVVAAGNPAVVVKSLAAD
jgi:acetyltransferase-like isoleucine patch superfamily enzyme